MHFSALVIGIFLISRCEADPLSDIAVTSNDLTTKLYNQLKSGNDNYFYSGVSEAIVFSLLTDGAKGETKTEIDNTCSLPSRQVRDEGFDILTTLYEVNRVGIKLVAVQKLYPAENVEISEEYKQHIKNIYKTEIENLNYRNRQAAANKINQWVQDNTYGAIKDIVSPSLVNPATDMIIVNALYFTAQFIYPFPLSNTKPRVFHGSRNGKNTKSVESINNILKANYGANANLKVKFLEIDLVNGDCSLIFLLPDEVDGLIHVEDNLDTYLAPSTVEHLEPALVDVTIPKFNISTTFDDPHFFKKLGIKKLFTGDADLTPMAPKGNLKVNNVVQKAVVTITELGFTAEDADVGILQTTCANPGPAKYTYNINHPFIFYIREKLSGRILQIGRFLG